MTTAKTGTKNVKSSVEELVEEAKKSKPLLGDIPVQVTAEETAETEVEPEDVDEDTESDEVQEDLKESKIKAAKAKIKGVFANKKVLIGAAATFAVSVVAMAIVNSLQNNDEETDGDEDVVDETEETPSA